MRALSRSPAGHSPAPLPGTLRFLPWRVLSGFSPAGALRFLPWLIPEFPTAPQTQAASRPVPTKCSLSTSTEPSSRAIRSTSETSSRPIRSTSETSSWSTRFRISARSRAAARDWARMRPPSVMVAAMMAMSSRVIWQFLSLTPPNLQLSAVTPTPSTPPAPMLSPSNAPPEAAPWSGDFLVADWDRRVSRAALGRTSFTRPEFFARRGDFQPPRRGDFLIAHQERRLPVAHRRGGFQPPTGRAVSSRPVGPIPDDRRGTPCASPAGSQRPPAESPLHVATPGARKDADPSRRVKHAARRRSRRLESRRSTPPVR